MIQRGDFNMLEGRYNAAGREIKSNMNLAVDVEEEGLRRAKNHLLEKVRNDIKELSEIEKELNKMA